MHAREPDGAGTVSYVTWRPVGRQSGGASGAPAPEPRDVPRLRTPRAVNSSAAHLPGPPVTGITPVCSGRPSWTEAPPVVPYAEGGCEMKRHYYLRGDLVEVDEVDDVVAVRGAATSARSWPAASTPRPPCARRSRVSTRRRSPRSRPPGGAWWSPRQGGRFDEVRASGLAAADAEAGSRPGRARRPRDDRDRPAERAAVRGPERRARRTRSSPRWGLAKVGVLRFAPHCTRCGRPSGDALAASVALHDDPRFVFAEPSLIEHIPGRFTPTDPRYGEQWQWSEHRPGRRHRRRRRAVPRRPGTAPSAPGMRVAVIDNGFDADHEDLAAGHRRPASGFFQARSPRRSSSRARPGCRRATTARSARGWSGHGRTTALGGAGAAPECRPDARGLPERPGGHADDAGPGDRLRGRPDHGGAAPRLTRRRHHRVVSLGPERRGRGISTATLDLALEFAARRTVAAALGARHLLGGEQRQQRRRPRGRRGLARRT